MVESLYEAVWTSEAKDEDERKRQALKNYMEYIMNTDEFKRMMQQEIEKFL